MTLSIKKTWPVIVGALFIALGCALFFGNVVKANPFQFSSAAKSAVATSSVTYLTPAVATTTIVYDSSEIAGTNETFTGNTLVPSSAVLLLSFAGSSTASVININFEYSQDAVDWYSDGVSTSTSNGLNVINSFAWTFASSTVGGAGITATTGATSTRAIAIDRVPTRFVRAVLTMSGTRGAVWGSIVPKKELR